MNDLSSRDDVTERQVYKRSDKSSNEDASVHSCLLKSTMVALSVPNMAIFSLLFGLQFIFASIVQAVPVRNDEMSGESHRNWRSIMIRDRESLPDYQPLCHSTNHRVDFIEPGYEFRPPFYHSIECKHTKNDKQFHHHGQHESLQICLQSGLDCVQRIKTIQIAKRKIGTSCWTLFTKEIHSGCECMWPVQSNGDSRHFS